MYSLPEIEQEGLFSCMIAPVSHSKAIPNYTFDTYEAIITVSKSGKSFTPFNFSAMTSKSILNVLQLQSYKDMHFLSEAWKEAYYIIALKELEKWAKTLDVRMLIIQTTDKVALEAMLEQNFMEFSVINNNTDFSVSGRKWYDVRKN